MIGDWWKAHRFEIVVECTFLMLLGVVFVVGLLLSARRRRRP